MEFAFPGEPRELWDDPDRPGLRVSRLVEFEPNELDKAAERVAFRFYDREPRIILEQDTFDELVSILRLPDLSQAKRGLLGDALASSLTCLAGILDRGSQEAPAPGAAAQNRFAMSAYVFFLDWLVKLALEKPSSGTDLSKALDKAGRRKRAVAGDACSAVSGSVDQLLSKVIKAACTAANCDLWALFRPVNPDERLLLALTSMAMATLRELGAAKDSTAVRGAGQVLGAVALRYRQMESVSAALVDFVSACEHAPAQAALALEEATLKLGDNQLAVAVIGGLAEVDPAEYARQQTAVGERAGVRSVGPFLEELAARLPQVVAKQMSVILTHLGGTSHTLRSSIVTVTATLLMRAFRREEDQEESANATAARLRFKQSLLQVLVDRVRDVSSYTRKACLAAWASLAEGKALPLSHWDTAAALAIGRLEDKSSLVRKEALRLIQCLLLHNPFGPALPVSAFTASLEAHRRLLSSAETETVADDFQNLRIVEEGVKGEPVEKAVGVRIKAEPGTADQQAAISGWEGSLEELKALVASLDLAARFAKALAECMPTLSQLLASSTLSDVQDSLSLLLTCKQFSVDGVDTSLRRSLPLIFSKDVAIKGRLVEATAQLYVLGWAGNMFGPSTACANLVELCSGATLGELTSLEVLVKELVAAGHINHAIVLELWSRVERAAPAVTSPDTPGHELALRHLRSALCLLSFITKARPEMLPTAWLPTLVSLLSTGSSTSPIAEPLVAKWICGMLCALGPQQQSKETPEPSSRLTSEQRDSIATALTCFLTGPLRSPAAQADTIAARFYPAAGPAIDALYATQENPLAICYAVLEKYSSALRNDDDVTEESLIITSSSTLVRPCLGPFLFMLGHTALAQLVAVESETRKARRLVLERDSSSAKPEDEEDINSELGVGAVAADAALEGLREASEREILGWGTKDCLAVASKEQGAPIFARHASLVSSICHSRALLTCDPSTRSAALSALTKLMTVDGAFCSAHLPLLFTLLQGRAIEPGLRSTLVVAAADAALRFPNALEAWAPRLYAPLADSDPGVRRDALTVISHLILNDMVKLKGHIAHVARCLVDEDERCAALASLFFHELAKREVKGSNPVYNLLPDMLSALSSDACLGKSNFQKIMRILLGYVKRDKQCDALVEKLCQRFAAAAGNVVQWHNVAFCLTQLPMSEKGLKKLLEGFKLYKEALADAEVAAAFQSILTKAKKTNKALAEEIEEKITEAMASLQENGGEAQATSYTADGDNEESKEADGNVPSTLELASQLGEMAIDDAQSRSHENSVKATVKIEPGLIDATNNAHRKHADQLADMKDGATLIGAWNQDA